MTPPVDDVPRFDKVTSYSWGGSSDAMEREPDGEWVRWEDVERLAAKRDAQVREAFEAAWRARYSAIGIDLLGGKAPTRDAAWAAYLATRARVSGDTREE